MLRMNLNISMSTFVDKYKLTVLILYFYQINYITNANQ